MTARNSGAKYVESVVWVVTGLLGASLLVLLPVFDDRRIWHTAFDAGHAPLFTVFTLLLLRLSRLWIGDRIDQMHHYAIAAVVAAAGGVLTEAVQVVLPRDASVMDLVRDLVGIGAGISAHWVVCSKRPRAAKTLVAAVALAGIFATFLPLLNTLSFYRARRAAFPRLLAFDRDASALFLDPVGVELDFDSSGITVTYLPGIDYPAFEIVEVERDWSAYRNLAFRVINTTTRDVALNVRAHDGAHNDAYRDRYNGEFTLSPGEHEVTLPLRELREAPAKRDMDLTNMRNLNFFLIRPSEPTRLVFKEIRLEGRP